MSLLPETLKMLVANRITDRKVRSVIYYVACPETQRIKIGYTKKNPIARLRALRIGSPTDIRLVAFHPGTMNDEKFIHDAFPDQRLHGEWFEMDEALFELMCYIAWATASFAESRGDEVPKWARLGLKAIEEASGCELPLAKVSE